MDKVIYWEGEYIYGILVREKKDGICCLMIILKVFNNGVGRDILKWILFVVNMVNFNCNMIFVDWCNVY